MKAQVQPMYLSQFHRFMLDNHPAMDVGDIRPYKTIMRYVQDRGYVITPGLEGTVILVKKHRLGNGDSDRPLRADELCTTVGRWARAAERAAKTSFQRQCAEEDQEEMELLKERCQQTGVGRQAPLYALTALAGGNGQQQAPYRGYASNSSAYAMDAEMTSFVQKVSDMCDEDALDLDA